MLQPKTGGEQENYRLITGRWSQKEKIRKFPLVLSDFNPETEKLKVDVSPLFLPYGRFSNIC